MASRSRATVDVPAMQAIAETLGAEHPAWLVIYGTYTREFLAFPKLFDGPPWITAGDSITLAALMGRAEARAPGKCLRTLSAAKPAAT